MYYYTTGPDREGDHGLGMYHCPPALSSRYTQPLFLTSVPQPGNVNGSAERDIAQRERRSETERDSEAERKGDCHLLLLDIEREKESTRDRGQRENIHMANSRRNRTGGAAGSTASCCSWRRRAVAAAAAGVLALGRRGALAGRHL